MCTASSDQNDPVIAPDGAGGAIVVWEDRRSGASDIYAMRVRANGNLAGGWPAQGLAVCTAVQSQVAPVIVPDGSGGAYVAWEDYRAGGANPDIYVQRVTATGEIAGGWPADGVGVCTLASVQGRPSVIPDGSGGAILAWEDFRSGTSDVYAQRVSGAGTVQWLANGVPLCTAGGGQRFPLAVSDGAGGAIVVWEDGRGNGDVYARRVSAAGTAQWAPDGVPVCAAPWDQFGIRAASDGEGGVLVSWEDYRDGNSDVYAQRLAPDGSPAWTVDGVPVCTHLDEQYGAVIAGDGAGGAFVAWVDLRSGGTDVYAHHVAANGTLAGGWPADGLAVCAEAGNQFDPVVTGDDAGGAYFGWNDTRTGSALSDVYAQRVAGDGTLAPGWGASGTALCSAAGDQYLHSLQPDGAGGALLAWSDLRSGGADVYALRITGSGKPPVVGVAPGGPDAGVRLAVTPNPVVTGAELRFALAATAPVEAWIVDVAGRRVRGLLGGVALPPGDHRLAWDGRDQHGRQLPAGVYLALVRVAGEVRSRPMVVVP